MFFNTSRGLKSLQERIEKEEIMIMKTVKSLIRVKRFVTQKLILKTSIVTTISYQCLLSLENLDLSLQKKLRKATHTAAEYGTAQLS